MIYNLECQKCKYLMLLNMCIESSKEPRGFVNEVVANFSWICPKCKSLHVYFNFPAKGRRDVDYNKFQEFKKEFKKIKELHPEEITDLFKKMLEKC